MKMDAFKRAQKVNMHLGYFFKKICHQELSKIAQSGHTGCGSVGSAVASYTRSPQFESSRRQTYITYILPTVLNR